MAAGHGPDFSSRSTRKKQNVRRIYWLRSRKLLTRRPVQDVGARAALTCSGRLRVRPKSKLKSRAHNLRHSQNIKEINEAFTLLSDILPQDVNSIPSSSSDASDSSLSNIASNNSTVTMNKLTRVATLRQATSYIKALSELLNNTHLSENGPENSPSTSDDNNNSNSANERQSKDCGNIENIEEDSTESKDRKTYLKPPSDETSTLTFIIPNKKLKIACDPSSEIKR